MRTYISIRYSGADSRESVRQVASTDDERRNDGREHQPAARADSHAESLRT